MNEIRYPATENELQNTFFKIKIPELKNLQASLTELKNKFFVTEEFAHLDRNRLPQGILKEACIVPEEKLADFAVSLKSRQLDGLLLDLAGEIGPEEAKRAAAVCALRCSDRVVKLFNQIFQYHYDKPGVKETAIALGLEAEKRKTGLKAGDLIRLYAISEDKDAVRIAMEAIIASGHNIPEFNQSYRISPNSPLAIKAYIEFFNRTTEREIFQRNRNFFVQLIKNEDLGGLSPLIKNYLSLFDVETYEIAVNIAILKYLGQPYTSALWDNYDNKLKKKFALWCFWYELHKHFINKPQKMAVLAPYIKLIRSTEILTGLDDALVIDFGDLVVVDIATDPFSFFYRDKELYDSQIKAYREEGILPLFMQKDKTPYTARDFIIVSEEGPCIKLSYESVNIFYIREMLDIIMELEPDLRKKSFSRR